MSQTFNSPGSLSVDPPAAANILPSGLNATDLTASVPLWVTLSLPLATSQSLTVLSRLAEARILPSGLNATDITDSVCPWRVARSLLVARSQSLTVLSPLAEARVLLFGLNATA